MSTIPSDFNQSLLDLNPKNQRKRSICSSFKNCFSFLLTKRSSSTYENINNSFTKNTDENSKNTLDSFMNSINKTKQIKINSIQPKIESYVPNELFILKGNRSGYAIFIKITEIKLEKKKVSPFITLDSAKKMLIENGIFIEESKNSKVINKLMKIPFIFSLETEKIHFSLNYILNTKFPKFEICEYISNRLKGNSILDCTGGIGEFTIPVIFFN